MLKPVLISISPNTTPDDVLLAFKTFFNPTKWQLGQAQIDLQQVIKDLFNTNQVFLLNSGRVGLEMAVKSLNLVSGDEVLCQALTCVAVSNSIIFAGAKPVYVDVVESGFNLNSKDLAKKITPQSKAIILQHSFGIPDNLEEILSLAKKHNLVVIEDCAVSLGAKYKNNLVGTFGDMTILSFGRDKVISSVFGGAILINNKEYTPSIKAQVDKLTLPATSWTLTQLLHPILFSIIVPTYYSLQLGKFTLGKAITYLAQKLKLITLPVSAKEKSCKISLPPAKLPNALAILALHQLKKLDKLNQYRQKIAQAYHFQLKTSHFNSDAIYLRFPLLVDHPKKLIKKASKKKVILGDWYRPIIAPRGVDLERAGYRPGSCPNAEAVSRKIINLPTHPRMNLKDVDRVVSLIKDYASI